MDLHGTAARLTAAGDELTDAGRRLGRLDPGAQAFAADSTGALGELGRALHERCTAALAARSREAAAHGARLTDLADSVRLAAIGYADAERSARDRHERGPQ